MGPYDRTTYGGKPVDWLTRAALEDVSTELYGAPDQLTILQGSYNAGGVAASAGTHDGGGAVDLAPYDADRKVLVLREHGFAAWHRAELWKDGVRVWGEHIHAELIGDRMASAGAKAQWAEYLKGENGLANHGPDDGPRDFVNNRYHWQRGAQRITRAAALMQRAQLLLSTGIRGYAVGKSRKALRDAASQLPKGSK
ncbi:MAG: hypothetical protein HOV78_11595 [Hamadaea sp.]|nr:hypothetical protein [Hamadaea sp.]